ncbi:MAG: malto-oligosyltrehalose trehalohydrolase [Oleiphilaceae bacterium]|nr:malto-oligosyltrehalose trehalohydrolase [Oleiphilaceae bacterium]
MKRHHPMPFGAELQPDGSVYFRLWAPGASRVELCLYGAERVQRLTMTRSDNGWYSLKTDRASAGALYTYRIDGGQEVPDPASRFQPRDVHGPSQVIDNSGLEWRDDAWPGRPWQEAVIYELHVGTFTASGDYTGVETKLDYLAELGVTAIELMPVSDFPGRRNWGYDGVLPFAPDHSYGSPEALKELIQKAHERHIMVFLDVVYNHFGPDGNYLHLYAPDFFTERHQTPWGAGINFDDRNNATVRDFFIHNALYWLEEYHLDGLRLDAVHAIEDDSEYPFLKELAHRVQDGPGQERHIHLVLENDNNEARYLSRTENLSPALYTAQWNDDIHHCLHVLLTGQSDGYYADYADKPAWYLGRCLAEGFGYQGEPSEYRNGRRRGESCALLPPSAFVSFLQNHDQIGNRAFGERIDNLAPADAVAAAAAVRLLSPSPPLLFMGEEFAAATPFQFFCDFSGELAEAVESGRQAEFSKFSDFSDSDARSTIPSPNDPATFERSKLDWACLQLADHASRLHHYTALLTLRKYIFPAGSETVTVNTGRFRKVGETAVEALWQMTDGSHLSLLINLAPQACPLTEQSAGLPYEIYAIPANLGAAIRNGVMLPWSVALSSDRGPI